MSTPFYTDQGGDVVDAPRPFAERFHLRAVFMGALAGALFLALCEWQIVAPIAEARDELRSSLEALAAENHESEMTLAGYDQFLAHKAEVDRRFEQATAAIPTSEQLPSVLNDVEELADTSRVHLVSFTPEAAKPVTIPAAPPEGQPDGQPALVLRERNIRIVVRSNYRDFESLMSACSTFPRLLTVNRFSARTAEATSAYTMEVSLGLTAYYKDAPAAASPPAR